MSIDGLVRFASTQLLNPQVLEATCAQTKMSLSEVFVAFARRVAEGFERSELSWSDCDAAMTHLFSYAYAVPGTHDLPDYAFRVFLAFDQGEYQGGGEAVTRKLLAELK
jgi:hypothetical protein